MKPYVLPEITPAGSAHVLIQGNVGPKPDPGSQNPTKARLLGSLEEPNAVLVGRASEVIQGSFGLKLDPGAITRHV